MAPAPAPAPAAAAAPSAQAATACSSSAIPARPASTASSQSSPRRTVPGLLLFTSLAALLILSSGEDAADASERPLKGVSLESPEVTFAPSSVGGFFCERIRISGIPRWQLQSYANQIHVKMNISHSMPEKFHWKTQICFHGNVSTALCQCEMGEWHVLQDGMWNAVKSPYGSKYVDVKLSDKKSTAFNLSIQEELQKWRLVCLGIGFLLLFLSPIVSKWAPFYYSSSMALGILLVVLIVLFQGMKLLPMGKKSLFYLTIYGSVLGVGSYAVHYFSTLVASILENFGLSEEMHNPVSVFLLVAVVLTGAGFGYWMVRRFIISKDDGSVDAGVAQFVKWAMRVVAIFFVMQSTLDPILALAALAACWWVCSVLTANKVRKRMPQKQKQSKVSSHPRFTQVSPNNRQVQFLSPSRAGTGRATTNSSARQYGWNNFANGGLAPSTLTKRVAPFRDEDYYSTFHNIEPRKYSKREWEDFTEECTRNELMKHTATPEFAQWAADNAHRLRVDRDDASEDETIESSSSSSEEVEKASGLLSRLF